MGEEIIKSVVEAFFFEHFLKNSEGGILSVICLETVFLIKLGHLK